ncbi:hypothetical protein [Deinococcus sp. PEB2-63]
MELTRAGHILGWTSSLPEQDWGMLGADAGQVEERRPACRLVRAGLHGRTADERPLDP